MKKKLRVFAPATIANVGPGFDLLGLAIDSPGDVIELEVIDAQEHRIINDTRWDLPTDPSRNVSTVALDAFLDHTGIRNKFSVRFLEKIPPGSGIGSSSASSAGAVFAANVLMGKPLGTRDLVPLAMKGEAVASGSEHADNVAPALLGGMTLVHS